MRCGRPIGCSADVGVDAQWVDVMPRSQAAPDRVRSSERRKLALELRARGLPYREIGEQLGVSMQAAHRLVVTALEALRTETAEAAADLRQLELERLDAMLAGLWEAATTGDTGAVNAVLRLCERRAKLCGLDAPTKHAPTDAEGATLDLAGLAAAARAARAERLDSEELRVLANLAAKVAS